MRLNNRFQQMKKAYSLKPMPSYEERITHLKKLKKELKDNVEELSLALNLDFKGRSMQDTMLELLPSINNIDYTIAHLKEWMLPSPRHTGDLLPSSKVEVVYQPKGVVGIISTWNAPIMVTINPLTTAIASGNRVMIKMSEFTSNLNFCLKSILEKVFKQDEVILIEGEVEIAQEFASLPFDHLLFTGSTAVGKLIMKSAAENLTPVTLELGGKSPVVIDKTLPITKVVERLMIGKNANNGQLCIAPDYVMIHEDRLNEFIREYHQQYRNYFPKGVFDSQLTSVANKRQFDRIQQLLEDAEDNDFQIIPVHEDSIDREVHRMVTHMVINPSPNSSVMTQEVFGPVLPIITYKKVEECITFIVDRPRPLACYLFSDNIDLQEIFKANIHSGGLCINDTIFHASVDDAPFGGIGNSGMGAYHGKEGFLTFSHAKTVLQTGEESIVKYLFLPGENEIKTQLLSQL